MNNSREFLSGFTLIELIIVIVLLSTLSVAVVVYFKGFYTLRLDAAANRLVSDIKYVQQLSISKQKNFGIFFNPDQETCHAYKENTSNIINEPLSGKELIVDYKIDEELQDVDLLSENFSNKLEFNPLGTPFDGTGSVLDYVGQIDLSYSGQTRIIKIESNTGKVWIE